MPEPDLQLKQGNHRTNQGRLRLPLFFAHPADAVGNRLNMSTKHAFSAMSQKKRQIPAGLRVICHANHPKCHALVTKKMADFRPFLYIFLNVMIYIYI